MKKLVYLAFLFLFTVTLFSVRSYSQVNPSVLCDYGLIPQWSGGAVWGHAACVLNDTLYLAGGSVNASMSASDTVVRYAINSGIWSFGRPLPAAKDGGSLVKCGNALYYVGGGTATTGTAATYKYTPAAGWTSVAAIPTLVVGATAHNWGDSVIFVVSGGWATYSTTVQFYRPGSDTWGTSTAMTAGTGRRSFAAGISGNKIIVAGGYSGTYRKDVQIGTIGANATTITWAAGPDVPIRGTGTSRPGGFAINQKFYFVTGETTPTPAQQDSIFVYDFGTSAWTSQIFTGRGANTASNYYSAVAATVLSNNKIRVYIPGGSFTGVTTSKMFVLADQCSVTGNLNNSNEIPDKYALNQNYPNPFNPVTTINFEIPKQGFVTLKVYDIMGKEIQTLVNETKQAGTYSVDFDGNELSSGVYIYKLETEGFSDMKRMMLVK
jgi:hypothetical protein